MLAEEIVSKTVIDGNVLDNIRNIKERIVFAADQFIVTQITVEVQKEHLTYTNLWDQAEKTLDKLYVTTDKPLMAFLSISKTFSVSAGNVLRKVYDLPRRYADADHIAELCGLLMIPILPALQPILDYEMKYRLGVTRGYELVLSSDGEIMGMCREVYEKNPFDYVGMDDILKNISFFDEYLF